MASRQELKPGRGRRDAAHDAFMAFWRGADTAEAEVLWLHYCAAQERYEQCLREAVRVVD
jgi:hypothetical protein